MKKLVFLLMLLAGQVVSPVTSVFAQNTPTILINGVAAVANNINANPYWLGAGQTVAIGNKVNAISVLKYNLAPDVSGGYKLQFEGAISVTSLQAVPTDKVWKIESAAIDPSATLGSGDNWGGQSVEVNTTLSGNGTTTSPLGLAQQGATSGQNLQWNGSAWLPATPTPQGVTNVATGAGLTGGPVTSTGTISLANGTGGGQVFITGSSPFTPVLVAITGDAAVSSSGVVKVNALESATTSVNVSSAAAPATGQILTATSPTTATWQTPSGGATCSTAPATPGTISGNAAACTGSIGTYFVPPVATATSYIWTFTGTGATVSGTTNSIVISFSTSATSGNLSVKASNACGTSASSATFAVTVNTTPNSSFTTSTNPAPGFTVTFTPTDLTNQLFFWQTPDASINSTTPSPTLILGSTLGNISLTVTKSGCNSTTVLAETSPVITPGPNGVTVNASSTAGGSQGFVQTLTIPSGITSITIEAIGAGGGVGMPSGAIGGKGAKMKGTFTVSSGQILSIVVGQQGSNGSGASGGGGGGSFVYLNSSTPWIIAGGGGGSGGYNASGTAGMDASTSTSGTASRGGAHPGGTNGTGGVGACTGGSVCNGVNGGAGGGGWLTAGGNDQGNGAGGGSAMGGLGGPGADNGGVGGFGGGAGARNVGGGGGGGYSGGGGGDWNGSVASGAGGGGSFILGTATSTSATAGVQAGNGSVIITW